MLRSRTAELLNPSVHGKRLLYVRVDRARQSPQKTTPPKLRQRLMLKRLGGHGPGHRIYSHGSDRMLWSTALSGRRGFVTLLGHGGPKIVSVRTAQANALPARYGGARTCGGMFPTPIAR